jgi:hypothetical protein
MYAVTTVDSGSKALQFLGLHDQDSTVPPVHTHQLVRRRWLPLPSSYELVGQPCCALLVLSSPSVTS